MQITSSYPPWNEALRRVTFFSLYRPFVSYSEFLSASKLLLAWYTFPRSSQHLPTERLLFSVAMEVSDRSPRVGLGWKSSFDGSSGLARVCISCKQISRRCRPALPSHWMARSLWWDHIHRLDIQFVPFNMFNVHSFLSTMYHWVLNFLHWSLPFLINSTSV